MPRRLFSVEGCIRVIGRRDDPEPPESLALGTFSKGFSRNLGKPHRLLRQPSEETRRRGQPETVGDGEESYEPILPMKMGNRRATEEVAATGPIGGKGRTNGRIG